MHVNEIIYKTFKSPITQKKNGDCPEEIAVESRRLTKSP
jgi:hypothetical protein